MPSIPTRGRPQVSCFLHSTCTCRRSDNSPAKTLFRRARARGGRAGAPCARSHDVPPGTAGVLVAKNEQPIDNPEHDRDGRARARRSHLQRPSGGLKRTRKRAIVMMRVGGR
eukprot:7123028-Prymnesium_polylepis.1